MGDSVSSPKGYHPKRIPLPHPQILAFRAVSLDKLSVLSKQYPLATNRCPLARQGCLRQPKPASHPEKADLQKED